MDPSTHTCCHGNPLVGHGSCCGRDKLYDPKMAKCCPTKAPYAYYPPAETRVIPYRDSNQTPEQIQQIGCCMLGTFNTVTEVCCNGKVT